MSPPEYPGLRLIDTRKSELPGAMEEIRLYLSNDSVFVVNGWLRKRMPGFEICSGNSQASCWQNEQCDHSLTTNVLMRTLYFTTDEARWPCVHVRLRADAYGSSRTLMEVKTVWPKAS